MTTSPTESPAVHENAVGTYDFRCVETLAIPRPVDRVYDALFRVTDWPRYLPHVEEIDVIYDDGQYQEFWMTVASETDGSPLRVRSIRNCRYRRIDFFQPLPPRFLRHHAGFWRFLPDSDGGCLVEVSHLWNLEPVVAAEVYPPTAGESTEQQVEKMLAGHSRLALESWRKVLTAEGARDADL
ncbi:SRPBCC family protein [Microbispora sp. NPDC049125]|uniref:SRPBCC family protein n=1 Tax=Microbispora sp. NPDC049125 TaxID=3154929 RepID=UPI0034652917